MIVYLIYSYNHIVLRLRYGCVNAWLTYIYNSVMVNPRSKCVMLHVTKHIASTQISAFISSLFLLSLHHSMVNVQFGSDQIADGHFTYIYI